MNVELLVAFVAIVIVLLVFALVATDKDVGSACDNDCNQGRRCHCRGLENCESGLRGRDMRTKFDEESW